MDNSSHRSTFLNNLLLLGFSPEQTANGLYKQVKFDEHMFTHANNTKAFIATSHFLFTKLDPKRARTTFKDCWPIVDFRRQSRLYIATAYRWLEELRREGDCLSGNVSLRRSYFEDCRGEKVEAIMTSLSMHVLKKTSRTRPQQRQQQQSSKAASSSSITKKATSTMSSQRHETTHSTQSSMQHKPVPASSKQQQQHAQKQTSPPKAQHHPHPRRTLTVDPHTLQLLKSVEMHRDTAKKDLQSIFSRHDSTLDMVHQIRSRARTIQRTISVQPTRSSTISPKQPTSIGSKRTSSDSGDDDAIRAIDQSGAASQSMRHLEQNSSKRDSFDDHSDRSSKRFKATHSYQQPESQDQHSKDQNHSGKTIFYTADDQFPTMSLSPESPNISPLNNSYQGDSCDEIVDQVIEGFHARTPGDDDDDDDDDVFKVTDSDKENATAIPPYQLPVSDTSSWTSSDRRAASDMRHELFKECSLSPIPFRHNESTMLSSKRPSVTRASTANNSRQASNENDSPRSPPHLSISNQENDPVEEKGAHCRGKVNPFTKVHDTPISRRITLRAKDNQYQNVYRHSLRFDTTRSEGNIYQYSPTEHLLLDPSKGWSAFRNM